MRTIPPRQHRRGPGGRYNPLCVIHCFVIDSKGRNAFPYLLNSHHQGFADAKLIGDDSEQGRAELVEKGTEVGLKALVAQVQAASTTPAPDKPAN